VAILIPNQINVSLALRTPQGVLWTMVGPSNPQTHNFITFKGEGRETSWRQNWFWSL